MVFDSSTIRRANSKLAIAQVRAQTMPHERATGLDGDDDTTKRGDKWRPPEPSHDARRAQATV